MNQVQVFLDVMLRCIRLSLKPCLWCLYIYVYYILLKTVTSCVHTQTMAHLCFLLQTGVILGTCIQITNCNPGSEHGNVFRSFELQFSDFSKCQGHNWDGAVSLCTFQSHVTQLQTYAKLDQSQRQHNFGFRPFMTSTYFKFSFITSLVLLLLTLIVSLIRNCRQLFSFMGKNEHSSVKPIMVYKHVLLTTSLC